MNGFGKSFMWLVRTLIIFFTIAIGGTLLLCGFAKAAPLQQNEPIVGIEVLSAPAEVELNTEYDLELGFTGLQLDTSQPKKYVVQVGVGTSLYEEVVTSNPMVVAVSFNRLGSERYDITLYEELDENGYVPVARASEGIVDVVASEFTVQLFHEGLEVGNRLTGAKRAYFDLTIAGGVPPYSVCTRTWGCGKAIVDTTVRLDFDVQPDNHVELLTVSDQNGASRWFVFMVNDWLRYNEIHPFVAIQGSGTLTPPAQVHIEVSNIPDVVQLHDVYSLRTSITGLDFDTDDPHKYKVEVYVGTELRIEAPYPTRTHGFGFAFNKLGQSYYTVVLSQKDSDGNYLWLASESRSVTVETTDFYGQLELYEINQDLDADTAVALYQLNLSGGTPPYTVCFPSSPCVELLGETNAFALSRAAGEEFAPHSLWVIDSAMRGLWFMIGVNQDFKRWLDGEFGLVTEPEVIYRKN